MHASDIGWYNYVFAAEHQLKESLNLRIAEVEQAFKNIPEMLYFSPSSVAYDGIGVYAAESLPKGVCACEHACSQPSTCMCQESAWV